MFQRAERYTASFQRAQDRARVLGHKALEQGQGAHARALHASSKALELAQHRLSSIKYEKPDTTLFALVGTALNLLNGTTGPGLLALPLAFSRCGWAMGTLLLVFVFALNHLSLLFLLKSCLAAREHSYIGLSARTGESVAALVDWASLLFFFGSCVSYLVIIGDAFNLVTARWGEGDLYRPSEAHHYAGLALLLLAAFTGGCLLPLSLLRSMDSLQPTSAVAMVCIVYTVAVVVCTAAPAEPSEAWRAVRAGGGELSSQLLTGCRVRRDHECED